MRIDVPAENAKSVCRLVYSYPEDLFEEVVRHARQNIHEREVDQHVRGVEHRRGYEQRRNDQRDRARENSRS